MAARKRKAKPKRWIQDAIKRPGALHQMLGVPKGKTIPVGMIRKAAAQTRRPKLRQRARFALTLRGLGRKKKRTRKKR